MTQRRQLRNVHVPDLNSCSHTLSIRTLPHNSQIYHSTPKYRADILPCSERVEVVRQGGHVTRESTCEDFQL